MSRNGFQFPSRYVAALLGFNTRVPQQVLTALGVRDFGVLTLTYKSSGVVGRKHLLSLV